MQTAGRLLAKPPCTSAGSVLLRHLVSPRPLACWITYVVMGCLFVVMEVVLLDFDAVLVVFTVFGKGFGRVFGAKMIVKTFSDCNFEPLFLCLVVKRHNHNTFWRTVCRVERQGSLIYCCRCKAGRQ